mgnify:CR=1 FL=1
MYLFWNRGRKNIFNIYGLTGYELVSTGITEIFYTVGYVFFLVQLKANSRSFQFEEKFLHYLYRTKQRGKMKHASLSLFRKDRKHIINYFQITFWRFLVNFHELLESIRCSRITVAKGSISMFTLFFISYFSSSMFWSSLLEECVRYLYLFCVKKKRPQNRSICESN